MRRNVIALAALLAASIGACVPAHTVAPDAGADTSTDADVVTPDEQIAIDYIEATCRALASCPTGVAHVGYVYAHGVGQCMREPGQYVIDYLREELRAGSLAIDGELLARCSEVLASGDCPAPILDRYRWFVLEECNWYDVFVPARRVGMNGYCGDRAPCDDGLECRSTTRCGSVCVETEVDTPCESSIDCRGLLDCSPRGLCELRPRRVRGLGQECGYARDTFEQLICEPGLYCAWELGPAHCARIPGAGDACTTDSLCAPGTFCIEGLCRAGPRQEGESCDARSHFETDPCDRPNGLVCTSGRCERVGRALGDPCIHECDDGLVCNRTCDDSGCTAACGTPRVWPEPLPDGSPCTASHECVAHWCRPESGLCGAPTPPCE